MRIKCKKLSNLCKAENKSIKLYICTIVYIRKIYMYDNMNEIFHACYKLKVANKKNIKKLTFKDRIGNRKDVG